MFLFCANEKGASWAYATPGFGQSLTGAHLKMLRQMANPDVDEAVKVRACPPHTPAYGLGVFLSHPCVAAGGGCALLCVDNTVGMVLSCAAALACKTCITCAWVSFYIPIRGLSTPFSQEGEQAITQLMPHPAGGENEPDDRALYAPAEGSYAEEGDGGGGGASGEGGPAQGQDVGWSADQLQARTREGTGLSGRLLLFHGC